MKKTKLITAGVAALVALNGYQYHTYSKDRDTYKQEIEEQLEVSKSIENKLNESHLKIQDLQGELNTSITDVKKLSEEVTSKDKTIKKQESQIDKLEQQLEKAEKRNESPSVSSNSVKETDYLITAYTNGAESTGKNPGDPAYGITTSGKTTQEGRTISCPPSLTLGTKVNIEGVGIRECEDRGGAIQGKRIDLYIANLSEAIEFGKQWLKVEILD
ncbi:3D domain-containing protein [Niallia taxi]|uniref:3D domain-containing protein n=1 Tax=Niallia taxi TaxID=2499688 RepID=UPI00300B235C